MVADGTRAGMHRLPPLPWVMDRYGLVQDGRGEAVGKVFRHGPAVEGTARDGAVARLFVTAPELLAAARWLLAEWAGPNTPENLVAAMDALREVVSRLEDGDGTAAPGPADSAQPETGAGEHEAAGGAPPAAGGAGAAAADGDGVVGGLTVRRFAGGHVEEAEALARAGAFMAPRLVLGREAKR